MVDHTELEQLGASSFIGPGVRLLHPEEDVLNAMLEGWGRQMAARNLATATVVLRQRQVRAFVTHASEYPWAWTLAHPDEWFADLRSVRKCSLSTIRGYQVSLRVFCEYLTDPAYGWPTVCQRLFGAVPSQVVTEANAARHVAEYEGQPSRRAFTRAELQGLFEHVDHTASTRPGLGVKGWASVFRDGVLVKVAYGYGTRRKGVSNGLCN